MPEPHPQPEDIAERIARQTLASRAPDYAGEVRRLLDAGRDVMRRCGTTARPRVADIVAAAGLSNDAFYRHFPSKDSLVAAILEDGTERLRSYLHHQMDKETSAERQVQRWVAGVLGQAADTEVAETTLAVLRNADGLPQGPAAVRVPLAELLHRPFTELGSRDPELDASLAAHGVVGILNDYLWRRARPTSAEIEHVYRFCLAAIRLDRPVSRRSRVTRGEPNSAAVSR